MCFNILITRKRTAQNNIILLHPSEYFYFSLYAWFLSIFAKKHVHSIILINITFNVNHLFTLHIHYLYLQTNLFYFSAYYLMLMSAHYSFILHYTTGSTHSHLFVLYSIMQNLPHIYQDRCNNLILLLTMHFIEDLQLNLPRITIPYCVCYWVVHRFES